MAVLRSARGGSLQRDMTDDGGGDEIGINPPEAPISGGPQDPSGNKFKPIELNPGQSSPTPTQGTAPQVNAGPVGSAPLVSPPSPTSGAAPVLTAPNPRSMVFPRSGGGSKLFGARGGQFGGGLTLGADQGLQGQEQPSDLIDSLMRLLSGGQ